MRIFPNSLLLNLFYVYGSVHRWPILIVVQPDATQSSLFIILQVHSTCFGCQQRPSSGVHKTVTTVSGTGHNLCAATSLQCGQAILATLEGGSCTVPEAVITVLCTHDGCSWHPEHVEWTCRIINRLLCVASRWTIINIQKVKVKWPRYMPGVAQRVGRGIALLFDGHSTRWGWVVSSTPRPHFNPRKDPVPSFTGYDTQKDLHSRIGRDEKKGKAQKRMESGSRKRSSSAGSEKMEKVGGRYERMEGYCSTGQRPQWAVVPMEEEY